MCAIRVDFTDTQNSEFSLMPVGDYEATLFNAEVREGRDTGKPYINWEYRIDGPTNAGRRVWDMTSLAPNALWRVKERLIAFGETPEALAGAFDLQLDKYFGRKVIITLGVEKYNNQDQNRVDNVRAASGAGPSSQPSNGPIFK